MKINYPGSLHNHTDFSNFRLRDSINTVETLIDRAIKLGHSVVAITEHETVASSIRAEKYYDKIKSDNPDFKLIRGNEIYLCRNGLNAQNFNKENDRYYHFILLAKDAIGHEQIREISTRAWSHSYTSRKMMRVPTYYQDLFDVIGSNPGHVIASTACLGGALATQLLKFKNNNDLGLYEKIKFWCNQLKELFGEGNFYLEMQPSHNKEQREKTSSYNYLYFVLNDDRDKLYARIDSRVEIMFDKGLLAEMQKLIDRGLTRENQSMQAIGYRELFDFFENKTSLEEVKELIKQNSRHYAKRQLTWFRREKEVSWINYPEFNYSKDEILKYMTDKIKEKGII